MISEYLEKLKNNHNLEQNEAEKCLDVIFHESVKDDDITKLLVLLAEKGETKDEIAGFSKSLLKNAVKLSFSRESIDLCGTGGSSRSRFNISTLSAFILASGGIKVIKHGNKGSRCPNGSFDLLEKLGCAFDLSFDKQEEVFHATNLCFVFARKYHPAMKKVVPARKKAGCRTIFNIIGPLCNPAQPYYQIIGTTDYVKASFIAQVLAQSDRKKCLVVVGEPGIDEISISGKTALYEVEHGLIKEYCFEPQDFNIPLIKYEYLPGGDADTNVKLFLDLIENRGNSQLKDMVCLNAGAAFYCAGAEPGIAEGYKRSCELIESGKVKEVFKKYIDCTASLPGA
ncbi:MAG: anthranilate phosphoribosyltransferase [Spirochaetales bacterium]|nr:anthranilate phosphoribosyltransferase [Spirochaetales bacterium]